MFDAGMRASSAAAVKEHLSRGGVLDDPGEGAGAVGPKDLVELRREGGAGGNRRGSR